MIRPFQRTIRRRHEPRGTPNRTRLERFIGTEKLNHVSLAMEYWPGPPIAMAAIPGDVCAIGGGEFIGRMDYGAEATIEDYVRAAQRRRLRQYQARLAHRTWGRYQVGGFTSLSDLISEATNGGKRRQFDFRKTGAGSTAGATDSLWKTATIPPAASNAAAAPGGTAFVDSTTGAFPFTNPAGGDTQHYISASTMTDQAANNLLLYDRLFGVIKTMNSTATEAVTGVPTRYQSTTATNQDYIGGNFMFVETYTVLPATAHNWTVCTYTDQAAAASTFPSFAGISSCAVERCDMPTLSWAVPYESGDVGIQTLTQMQCDALVASGAVEFVIGHPLAWFTHPIASVIFKDDGINTAFNFARIFDDAALAFLIPFLTATATATYTGSIVTVAG